MSKIKVSNAPEFQNEQVIINIVLTTFIPENI